MQSQLPGGSQPGRPPAERNPLKRPAEPSRHRHEDSASSSDEPPPPQQASRKPKATPQTSRAPSSSAATMRGLLREFLEQQLRLDLRRREAMERRARERVFFEEQWREAARALERERVALEREWVEREERRRAREEARAQRTDAVLTAVLTRLLQGDL